MLQAVMNLVGNALKFNRAGGWVELSLERIGAKARLTIADSGAGKLPALAGVHAWPAEGADSEKEVESKLNGLGVVAVDHNDDTLGWLQHLLAAHGAMAWKARSVEEALALVERQSADVLVSDLSVIDEHRDVVEALHAGAWGKRVAAVALSTRPTDDECRRADSCLLVSSVRALKCRWRQPVARRSSCCSSAAPTW
jgi:hypothetical protein